MERSCNTDVPFFTYGIFKPGQLGYHQIAQFVDEDQTKKSTVEGILYERDGTPLLSDSFTSPEVDGYLIKFNSVEEAEEAYDQISKIEPDSQYDWDKIDATSPSDGHTKANVLKGLAASNGGEEIYNGNWDGRQDPLFNCALELVENILYDHEDMTLSPSKPNLKPFFEIQMAYSLLWSSIERYVSLRYGLRGGGENAKSINEKLKQMARNEEAFASEVAKIDESGYRPLRRTDEPHESEWVFRPHNPEEAITYYYRVRSNLFHRGKRASTDFDLLKSCLRDLHTIFQDHVLPRAFGHEWQRNSC